MMQYAIYFAFFVMKKKLIYIQLNWKIGMIISSVIKIYIIFN